MKTFSTKESLRIGWRIVKSNLWFAMGTTLVYLIFNMDLSGKFDGRENWVPDMDASAMISFIALALAAFILFWLIRTLVQIGYYKINLKLLDGSKPLFKELFTNRTYFWRYVGTTILFGLRVFLGFILLVVPGIIWAIKFQFMPVLTVDRGLRPVEAMRESARMTEGHKWHLFKFGLAALGVNLLGLLCLGVGLLVTVPLTTLAYLHVYRSLS